MKLVLPKLKELGQDNFECVALIKPQFEVGRSEVGKNGVVRSPELHIKAIQKAMQYVEENQLYIKDINFSPIKGPKGNIEFLIYLTNEETKSSIDESKIKELVEETHKTLSL